MIVRIVKMTFKTECTEEFILLYERVSPHIKAFDGCRSVSLLRDVSDDRVMMTYSLWDDEDSLNRYRHSDFFKQTWTTTKQLFAQKAEAVSLNEIKI